MKKLNFLLLLTFSGVLNIMAQETETIHIHHPICTYHKTLSEIKDIVTEVKMGDPDGLVPVVEEIKRVTKLMYKDFMVLTVPDNTLHNAVAFTEDGQQYMLFDIGFLDYLNDESSTEWAAISVIAHEIGHHHYNHNTRNDSRLKEELEADEFSGYALARLGASKEAAIAAAKVFGSDFDSDTHPNKKSRIEAISRGWERGKKSNKY